MHRTHSSRLQIPAAELATAATVGDQLILTPNQFGLEGDLAVVVTRLGLQGGASARLRVVVRTAGQRPLAGFRARGRVRDGISRARAKGSIPRMTPLGRLAPRAGPRSEMRHRGFGALA